MHCLYRVSCVTIGVYAFYRLVCIIDRILCVLTVSYACYRVLCILIGFMRFMGFMHFM